MMRNEEAMKAQAYAAQQDYAQGYAKQATAPTMPPDPRKAIYARIDQLHERVRSMQFILDSLPETFWRDHRALAAIGLLMEAEARRP